MDPQTAQQTPVSTPPAAPTTPVEAAVPVSPTPPADTPAAPTTPMTTPPQPEIKKSSNMMWIIMIVVIVAILAVAGWFLYQYSMNKTSDSMYPAATVSPTAVPSPTIGAVESGDAQLDEQSDAIDESMMKVETDVKGVDAGLNSKPEDLNP